MSVAAPYDTTGHSLFLIVAASMIPGWDDWKATVRQVLINPDAKASDGFSFEKWMEGVDLEESSKLRNIAECMAKYRQMYEEDFTALEAVLSMY